MKTDSYRDDKIADNKGLRYDDNKTQYHLIPGDGLSELARVYMFGAKKYAPYNWERGMDHSRVFNSLLRHLYAYWDGEARDAETGLHHMAHAAWNAIALLVYSLRGIGVDDRKASFLSEQQNQGVLGSLEGLIERQLPGKGMINPRAYSNRTGKMRCWNCPDDAVPGTTLCFSCAGIELAKSKVSE